MIHLPVHPSSEAPTWLLDPAARRHATVTHATLLAVGLVVVGLLLAKLL